MRRHASESALIVFVRAPQPGCCKTRLCPPLSPELAAELHRAMCVDVLRTAEGSGFALWIAYEPSTDFPTPGWASAEAQHFDQRGSDLGARMAHAFDRAFDAGYRRVVLIGGDVPTLPSSRPGEAFAALDGADAVLGPAADGGYYLVGLRAPQPALFEGIAWSTPDVLRVTRDIAARAGLRVRLLAEERDVDTPDDLGELAARLAQLRSGVAPATRAVLDEPRFRSALESVRARRMLPG